MPVYHRLHDLNDVQARHAGMAERFGCGITESKATDDHERVCPLVLCQCEAGQLLFTLGKQAGHEKFVVQLHFVDDAMIESWL